ncbi:hypothetical protein FB388_2245 [Pseudonocardia cypriaca]|uniref:Uncharacterized protein n=1 Tax=Pseudonocardia cypriaca TaxID=882449 RepID=A0A543GFJ7_9PSEU|nr:hypothetical protein FB388_2245 [Pseudonocardia cypriaca]
MVAPVGEARLHGSIGGPGSAKEAIVKIALVLAAVLALVLGAVVLAGRSAC